VAEPECALIGESLISLGQKLSSKVLICAVQRGDQVIIPTGNFMIREGDRIHFTSDANSLRDFLAEIRLVKSRLRNIMIVGGNQIGYYLADELSKKKYRIKLIENDKAVAEELAKYLPLTGGKMQGNLAPSSLYANTPAGEVTFGVGTTWNDSPSLSLYGSNVNGPNAGSFILRAGNQTYDLFGNANGELRWGVKNIVRSVNGVAADAAGNGTFTTYPTVYSSTSTSGTITLPSGGTWRGFYFEQAPNGDYCGGRSFEEAGGKAFTKPSTAVLHALIAIRVD
jgi:hypothetical protein